MADTYLDVINENDEVIGRELRSVIHRDGLLHREVHVWFITPNKEVIFQKRSMTKDTFPGLFDATVGGHVELDMTYEQAAVAEMEEEAGLAISLSDIQLLFKRRSKKFDSVTEMTNNVHRRVYGYVYKGDVTDLSIEDEAGAGFAAYSLDLIFNPTDEMRKSFIPGLLDPEIYDLYRALEKLVA